MKNIEQLKQHFQNAELPNTLDGEDRYYNDVPWTVNLWIETAESNPTDTRPHKRAVKFLNVLIHDLENRSKWNAPKQKLIDVLP